MYKFCIKLMLLKRGIFDVHHTFIKIDKNEQTTKKSN